MNREISDRQTTRARVRRLVNRAEWMLWITGFLCLGFFVFSWGARHAAAQHAVAQFAQARAADAASSDVGQRASTPEPDQQLWSENRIAAYARSAANPDARAAQALLRIPRLDLEAPLFEGTDAWALNRGLGRIPGTAQIGAEGNLAVAGHRDGFFRVLKDIAAQDQIEIVGTDSTTRYRVTDTWIVDPDAVHVLEPTGEKVITLVTCYPFYYLGSAPQRFIVRATAVESP